MDLNAEAAGHLECIDDVEVMSPGFGKVLPGVHRSVGGNETVLPVGRRPLTIVTLERLLVILSVVTKQAPAFSQHAAVAHQNVPVMVTNLVPEMTKEGAIRL